MAPQNRGAVGYRQPGMVEGRQREQLLVPDLGHDAGQRASRERGEGEVRFEVVRSAAWMTL